MALALSFLVNFEAKGFLASSGQLNSSNRRKAVSPRFDLIGKKGPVAGKLECQVGE
jgi:hypothetical protein